MTFQVRRLHILVSVNFNVNVIQIAQQMQFIAKLNNTIISFVSALVKENWEILLVRVNFKIKSQLIEDIKFFKAGGLHENIDEFVDERIK